MPITWQTATGQLGSPHESTQDRARSWGSGDSHRSARGTRGRGRRSHASARRREWRDGPIGSNWRHRRDGCDRRTGATGVDRCDGRHRGDGRRRTRRRPNGEPQRRQGQELGSTSSATSPRSTPSRRSRSRSASATPSAGTTSRPPPRATRSPGTGSFGLRDAETGRQLLVQVQQAGTFKYICAIHPFMKGSVKVTQSSRWGRRWWLERRVGRKRQRRHLAQQRRFDRQHRHGNQALAPGPRSRIPRRRARCR